MTVVALMQASGAMALFFNAVPILAIVVIFYFFVIAPANKQRKKTEEMLAALKKGDRVITTGGIHGSIQSVEEQVVWLRIADNVKIKVQRSSIGAIVDSD